MAHENKVLQSINWDDEGRCVDIFMLPDGTFGFEECCRDMEDGNGWFPIGFYGDNVFESKFSALSAAKRSVVWLDDVLIS